MEDNPKRQTNRWFRVDVGMPEHPKLEQVGPLAAWAYLCSIAYCARNLTDGYVPYAVAFRFASCGEAYNVTALQIIDDLDDVGLWDYCDIEEREGFRVHDYLDYQESSAEILALRQARAEAGRLGGLARSSKQTLKQTPSKRLSKTQADLDLDVDREQRQDQDLPPGGAQALTAHFVDESRKRGSEPSKRIVGMLAGRVSALLAENISAEAIHAGIELMLDRRKGPQLLDSFVHEAALISIRAPWQPAPEPEVDYPLLPIIEDGV